MGKVMVTGALGNVGGYTVKYLLEKGQEVVVADIDMEKLERQYGGKASCVYFDFPDAGTFSEALEDVDRAVYYASASSGQARGFTALCGGAKGKGRHPPCQFSFVAGCGKKPGAAPPQD